MDLFQKARIRWDVEEDENSKFCHGIINSKRNTQKIHGILHEGAWISDPNEIKSAFLNFYKDKFSCHDSSINFPSFLNANHLSDSNCAHLDAMVSLEEIKQAVWDCGSQKAPGPDGFSFMFPPGVNSSFFTLIPKVTNPLYIKDFRPISLIGFQYKIVAKILANRLSKVIDSIISHEQSAFVSGRQILDGPLILSEVIDWYKKRKKKLLLFKVDFEKAFDSLSWRFLDHVMNQLGFSMVWRRWIKAGLMSSRASILINRSPTSKFSLKRGLRQGDPLSPFLFIIVIEGLNIALKDGLAVNMFRGVNIGSPGNRLSHLFYADDIIILSEWSQHDMDNIIHILNVFYLASGLKININKSNLYRVGVPSSKVKSMAVGTSCSPSFLPFSYLGLPIGSNMGRISSWNILIDRFKAKLSGWKANMLSSGGRLTLIKLVLGSLGIYYLSIFKVPEGVIKILESLSASFFWGASVDKKKLAWIKWSNTLASCDKGGLGVGSLKAFNHALLLKWRWRLLNHSPDLWVNVLKSIHGEEAGLDLKGCQTNCMWARIVGSIYNHHSSGYIPLSSF
ncbi:putative RNA-directed DNA polymerase, eukaryota, reverse transcriptase zinc-binding domain protein [Tanacetum coccineum]